MFLVQHLRDWMTRRRLTAGLLLVVSLVMLFPISMRVETPDAVLNAAGKDASEPFPCQNRTCGCRSAKQCWKKCCCFTNAQKVAWAQANRVQLPAFVLAAAERESSVVTNSTSSAETCCTKHAAAPRQTVPPAKVPHSKPRIRLVVGVDALQCQGVEQTVTGQLISVQPPRTITIAILNLRTCEVMVICDSPLTPCEQEPPTPPPRLLTA